MLGESEKRGERFVSVNPLVENSVARLRPVRSECRKRFNPRSAAMGAAEDNQMSPKRLLVTNPLQALQSQRPGCFHRKIFNMKSCCSCCIGCNSWQLKSPCLDTSKLS